MEMSRDAMMRFAAAWIANWNRRDVEAVLGHFADDATFVSPVARDVVGEAVLTGKEGIGAYWRAALDRIPSLRFTLDHATWDDARRELTVIYVAERDGRRRRACEIMTFDAAGRQVRGEAFYGADL
ncbi:nuclear transport factor 2 family protein [Methylobacterium sp. NEAU 140]|uniref:nuclear transport factor 2 family protein n=1 Tax=Methylobacterium sp. NEAU 140 TaxID=3064945 RepID=UPI00273395BF|nr:nuclear transport factor 2 family protein [Methylobacterium sp. NEAU 140]MDP4023370.1 nuclear transport factor 2 family protein [Methylobacterium sp. NEAU 140]